MTTTSEMRQVVREALHLARAISDAYDRNVLPGDILVECKETDTQALIRRDGDRLLVAVPGTQSKADALTDIRVWTRQVDPLPGRWHRGFARAALAIYPAVEGAVLAAKADALSIGGHSLGGPVAGALAARMAERTSASRRLLERNRDDPAAHRDSLHSFEAPRYCNRSAAQFLKWWWRDGSWRWTFGFDVVPSLIPPFSYRHVGQHIAVGSDGRARRNTGTGRWARELFRAIVRPGINAFGDHGHLNIVGWLENAAVAVDLPIEE